MKLRTCIIIICLYVYVSVCVCVHRDFARHSLESHLIILLHVNMVCLHHCVSRWRVRGGEGERVGLGGCEGRMVRGGKGERVGLGGCEGGMV